MSGSRPSEHGLKEVRSPAKYRMASDAMDDVVVDPDMDDRDDDASDAAVDCAL